MASSKACGSISLLTVAAAIFAEDILAGFFLGVVFTFEIVVFLEALLGAGLFFVEDTLLGAFALAEEAFEVL